MSRAVCIVFSVLMNAVQTIVIEAMLGKVPKQQCWKTVVKISAILFSCVC